MTSTMRPFHAVGAMNLQPRTTQTPIYSTTVTDPQIYGLRLGTISQKTALAPKSMGWTRSMLGWVTDLRGLTRFEKQRP